MLALTSALWEHITAINTPSAKTLNSRTHAHVVADTRVPVPREIVKVSCSNLITSR